MLKNENRYEKWVLNVFKAWIEYIDDMGCDYTVSKRMDTLSFPEYFPPLKKKLEYEVRVDEQNYCLYVKMPVKVDRERLDEVSEYILKTNGNPMFAHFVLDYDKGEVFCVHGVFCEGKIPGYDNMLSAHVAVKEYTNTFGKGIVMVAEKNVSAGDAYRACLGVEE